jgi:riboflavin synthase
MFVGVIKDTGVVEQTEPELVIKVDSDASARIETKSHVAINGRVFKVLSKEVNDEVSRLKFYSSNLNRANNYSSQEKVNLEPAVRLGEEIPGTFFYGIPTGIAKLVAKELLPNDNLLIKVAFENDLVNYLSVGDCVCLDGVFVQIINLDDRLISFNIYSSTLKSTNLRDKQSGFNIELDPFTLKIAKLFQKFNFQ